MIRAGVLLNIKGMNIMKRIISFLSASLFLFGVLFGQTPGTITAVDSLITAANGTQYTANDVVNDTASTAKLMRFQTVSISSSGTGVVVNKGMGGIIVGATLTAGDSANTTNGNFRLLLFKDTVGVVADNVAWATAAYYNTRFIDYIDFQLTNDGTTALYATASTSIAFQTETDDRYIYGVLLAKAAYTKAFRQKFIVKLRIVRN